MAWHNEPRTDRLRAGWKVHYVVKQSADAQVGALVGSRRTGD
jgi:hypothetical protein